MSSIFMKYTYLQAKNLTKKYHKPLKTNNFQGALLSYSEPFSS